MKNKALHLETSQSKELKSYQRAQKKISNRPFEIIDHKTLLDQITRAQVCYIGDFHSFDQSSRNMERIIRQLDQKKLVLGMELVHHEHQGTLDAYISGLITELEFLQMIDYQNSWRFPWGHYKRFFDMAKEGSLKILALNSDGKLEKRDQTAAELITTHIKKNPASLLVVFFGELHIIPEKLPLRVQRKIPEINQVIIHQNLDEVYWNLFEKMNDGQNLSQDTIVQFGPTEFSLQTSPPWTKYESIIYWYEHLVEDPEFEIHEYLLQSGPAFNSSVPDTFHLFAKNLNDIIEQNLPDSELEDFNLYDHNKLKLIERKLSELPIQEMTFYKKILMRGRSFKIPRSSNYYCSSYSVNRISYLAGIHLQYLFLREKYEMFEKLFFEGQLERFSFFLLQDTIGLFSSKVFNPYRKCDHYLDLKCKLSATTNSKGPLKDEENFQVISNAIKILEVPYDSADFFEQIHKIIKGQDSIGLYYTARIIGHILGELIYERLYRKDSKLFQQTIMALFLHEDGHSHLYKNVQLIFKNALPEEGPYQLKKRIF